MSKKLLSAVLAIAMVVSLCASLFTVSTSAATNYESDRAALKEAIYMLYVRGPEVSAEVREFLIDAGILAKACNDCGVTNGDLDRAKVFKSAYVGHNHANGAYECGDLYLGEYDIEAIEDSILEAASAYYFGQQADSLAADASFNEGRNAIVKSCTSEINAIIAALKANVGAFVEGKPGYDAQTKETAGYAAVYEAWATAYHNTAYNPNFGINPYYGGKDSLLINDWYKILQGYAGVTFPLWYSFDEMRADSVVAPLLNAFERLYRAAQTNAVSGKLFYDFVLGEKAALDNAWKALVDALMAKYTWKAPTSASAANEIKAFHNMLKVVDFYDYYISDAYQNIYTSANQQLLANVAMAKLVEEFVGNDAVKIFAIGADYFNNLTNAIVAGLAELNPAAAGLALSGADIAAGVALVNEAQALLNHYAWSGNDTYKNVWNALNTAVKDLKIMLPYDAVSAAIYTIPANTSIETLDLDKSTKNTSNDAITITFMPNYFAFVRFMARLEAALADMSDAIDDFNGNVASLDKVSSSSDLSKAALKDVLLAYDFLAGYLLNNDVVNDDDFSEIYVYYLGDFYESIVAWYRDDNWAIDDDQAFTQAVIFTAMFEEALEIYTTDNDCEKEFFADIAFGKSSWDWTTGEIGGEKNGYAAVAEELVAFLPYLTAELQELINLYAFIADVIFDHFYGWEIIDNEDDDLYCHEQPENYPGYETTTVSSYEEVLDNLFTGADVDIFDVFGTDRYDEIIEDDGAAWMVNGVYAIVVDLMEAEGPFYTKVEGEVLSGGEYYDMLAAYVKLMTLCTRYGFGDYEVADSYVNAALLLKAYDAFIKEVKDLLTDDRGDELIDEFITDVISWKNTKYVKDDEATNNPWELYEKLTTVAMYDALELPEWSNEPYKYYNLTLEHVAGCDVPGNKYYTGDQFNEYIYAPLANKSHALEKYNVSEYDREWTEDFAGIRKVAGYVLELMNEDGSEITSDIPLYYVLNVIDALDAILDDADDHTVDAIAAYKAAVLNPAIANASNKSVYDYLTNTDAGAKVWAAYEAAYAAAVAAKYDTRMPKSEIDAVVETLNAAVKSLELVKKPASAATKADLEAKIVAAETLLGRSDDLDIAIKVMAVEGLKEAITNAKQFLVGYKYETEFNNSYDIDAAIAALQAAMDNVDDHLYFANDLAGYLGFVANAAKVNQDKYTAESYKAFVLAYNDAKAVAEVTDSNASVYAAAKAKVMAAYQALEIAPAPEMTKTFDAAVAKLAELKAVSTEGYTAESVAAFNAAVAALEAGIEAVAEDDALLELIANAYIAKAQLASVEVKNPVTCD